MRGNMSGLPSSGTIHEEFHLAETFLMGETILSTRMDHGGLYNFCFLIQWEKTSSS